MKQLGTTGNRSDRPATVVVVSSDRLVRFGLRYLLGRHDGIRLQAEANQLKDAAQLLVHSSPDVIIVDVATVEQEARDAAVVREIRCRRPSCRVVAFAPTALVPRLQMGDLGFALVVDRDGVGPELAETVRTLRTDPVHGTGESSGRRGTDAAGGSVGRDWRMVPTLTRREAEVLKLVACGYANPQIAATFDFSVATAKFHVHSLIGKFGVTSRTAVASEATRLGLV